MFWGRLAQQQQQQDYGFVQVDREAYIFLISEQSDERMRRRSHNCHSHRNAIVATIGSCYVHMLELNTV
jgi:hypothetical protein